MKRRYISPFLAGIGLATVTGSVLHVAAAEDPAPGTIITVAGTGRAGFSGDGGPATAARLNAPYSAVVDAAGNIYFADAKNYRLRKVSPDGLITTVAGTGISGYSGDGGLATQARVDFASGLALDGRGNLYFSQPLYNRIRKVSPEGIVTTVAGTGTAGLSGDGGPATAASLQLPEGLAVDAVGNLFIADSLNQRIRKVGPEGTITTVAGSGPTGAGKGAYAGDDGPATQARLSFPLFLAVDAAGNLYFSETNYDAQHWPPNEARVRKVSPDGIIGTVAGTGTPGFSGDGGLATEARLDVPAGVAVDTAGNLFIGDWHNYRVRKVDPNGVISTVAGNGQKRYAGDGVPATASGLRGPAGVAVDAAGNLLISDTEAAAEADGMGDRILKVFGVAAPGLLAGKSFSSFP